MPYGILAADQITSSVTGVSLGAGNATRFKSRIINGDMRIDQRNAGASVTVNNTALYTVDRWLAEDGTATGILAAQQVTDAPSGFTNSLKITASTGTGTIGSGEYSVITQLIEGNNVADLAWGSASAKTVTCSFWVKATTTGAYSCTLYNNGASRINPQSYTINVANTWEQKTINFTGDTTGTWLTNNGRGIAVNFYTTIGTTYQSSAGWNSSSKYGVTGSTNAFVTTGNTFQITGVQLEVGSIATGFEYVDYTTQLAMCQRYYAKSYDIGTAPATAVDSGRMGMYASDTNSIYAVRYPVGMRTSATLTIYSTYNGATGVAREGGSTTNRTVTSLSSGESGGLVAMLGSAVATNFYYFQYTASAEL